MLIDQHLQSVVGHTSGNRFHYFVSLCQAQFDKPAHSMLQMRDRQNKKLRGDLFELFCQRYLQHVRGFDHVWLWSDVPGDIRLKLGLNTRDEGIDIVARDNHGKYYAIQAKYRKVNLEKTKQFITWKQLSTFYALAYKIGRFHKHIVMTNVDGIRHVTKRTPKDFSICKRRFMNMTYWDWRSLIGNTDTPVIAPTPSITREEVRQRRLAHYLIKPDKVDSKTIRRP